MKHNTKSQTSGRMIGLVVEPELLERLKESARASDRTVSAEIRVILRRAFNLQPRPEESRT